MMNYRFTTAIGTPLTESDALHVSGLETHLADQAAHGFDSILVAGSMGTMQLLSDQTYRDLVGESVRIFGDKGDLLVGAGDCSTSRTLDRIEFLNSFDIDGVAVLCPFFVRFSQGELLDYFTALADHSSAPIFLYDLPQVVGTKLEMDTICKLAEHPNIAGAKCSCGVEFTRQLIDRVGDRFRVILACADLVDMTLRHGISEQLDGMWAPCPGWTMEIAKAVRAGDADRASEYQKLVIHARNFIVQTHRDAFRLMMNARGIEGKFCPHPGRRLTKSEEQTITGDPVFQRLIREDPVK